MPKKPDHLTPGSGKRRVNCFQCDGTGQMCNVCGNSRACCEGRADDECVEADDYEPCDNCEGAGQCYAEA